MRKKIPGKPPDHARWLVSYADFITLMFAFFTTMYAISNTDAQKLADVVQSMRTSFEEKPLLTPGSASLVPGQGSGAAGGRARSQDLVGLRDLKAKLARAREGGRAPRSLESLKREIDSVLVETGKKGKVETRVDSRGLVLTLGEAGLFQPGSDQLRPEGLGLLDTIAVSLVLVDNHVRVEGHTDNAPIRSLRFPSNWQLSAGRASAIVAHWIADVGFAPERLSATGFAEFRPISSNDSAEGRARNRRVDIVVMDPAQAGPR